MNSNFLESFLVLFFLSAVFCRSVERENLVPLPLCFSNSFLSKLIESESIEQIFDDQLENEETKLFSPQNLVVRWNKSKSTKRNETLVFFFGFPFFRRSSKIYANSTAPGWFERAVDRPSGDETLRISSRQTFVSKKSDVNFDCVSFSLTFDSILSSSNQNFKSTIDEFNPSFRYEKMSDC